MWCASIGREGEKHCIACSHLHPRLTKLRCLKFSLSLHCTSTSIWSSCHNLPSICLHLTKLSSLKNGKGCVTPRNADSLSCDWTCKSQLQKQIPTMLIWIKSLLYISAHNWVVYGYLKKERKKHEKKKKKKKKKLTKSMQGWNPTCHTVIYTFAFVQGSYFSQFSYLIYGILK